jgi:hypothetical protein
MLTRKQKGKEPLMDYSQLHVMTFKEYFLGNFVKKGHGHGSNTKEMKENKPKER